ncbi:diguanylate cyclase [Pseudomonas sp. SDI]|uniref:sensor domain-containing diguanylate cyclase n=1 Tax=Pseudomonas sp. SDI TaxID=2170734 RepID=UPI000DE6F198|nr:diguanylate cyclase [Pseudomonas sp. SDI]PWB35401.1 diguanylate cyclase [Pseudomonas sp. SDI]
MSKPSPATSSTEPERLEVRRLREIIAHNSDWIWEVDREGRYTFCSEHSRHLLGYAPEQVLGRTPFDFMPADEAARVGALFAGIIAEQRPFSGLINRNLRADGRLLMLETSGVPLFDEQGALSGYRGIDRDVTPAIGPLDRREVQLEALYAAASVALGLVDRQGNLVNVNNALAQLLGGSVTALVGQTLGSLISPQQLDVVHCLGCLERGETLADQVLDWQGRNYLLAVKAARDLDGQLLGMTLAMSDITEHCQMRQALAASNAQLALANAQLRELAEQDALTGLPNRRRFDEVLQRALAAMAGDDSLSLLMVDVDHFKAYNDCYGHQRGDECLRLLARLFREVLRRPNDTVCRYGGEEFAIILEHTGCVDAAQIAERLCARVVAEHIEHRGVALGRVTLSIGVASARRAGQDVLYLADQALYRAKESGRNGYCLS